MNIINWFKERRPLVKALTSTMVTLFALITVVAMFPEYKVNIYAFAAGLGIMWAFLLKFK